MTSIFNKLLTGPLRRHCHCALNHATDIDTYSHSYCTKSQKIQPCICLCFPHRAFQLTHQESFQTASSPFSQINLWCQFLCGLMMFTFLYLTDWDYFVCKSIVAAKCIYNRLGWLVKVELWHSSCHHLFYIFTAHSGLHWAFSPFIFFFRRSAITP